MNLTSENKYTKMYLKYIYCHLLYAKYVTHTFTYVYVHIMNTLHLYLKSGKVKQVILYQMYFRNIWKKC